MTNYFTRGGSPVTGDVHSIDERRGSALFAGVKTCHRCGGAGGGEQWRHTGWTCFECGGVGRWSIPEKCYTAERLAQLNATQAKAQAKRDATAKAKADAALAAKRAGFNAWFDANRYAVAALHLLADDSFVSQLRINVDNGHTLTERQLDTALATVVRKLAEADAAAVSRHVGTIGERIELTLTVERRMRYDSDGWPRITTWINICRDEHGNRIVYKGSNYLNDGRYRVTVKDHDERNGELQTIVARPKEM